MDMTLFLTMAPENCLVLGLLTLLTFDLLNVEKKKYHWPLFTLFLLMTLFSLLVTLYLKIDMTAFKDQLTFTSFTQLSKVMLLTFLLPLLFIKEKITEGPYKYLFLIFSVLYGSFITLSSHTFITLFIGIELMALPFYALVINQRNLNSASEAAMKFIFTDGAVTAMFLIGVALIYFAKGEMLLNLPANLLFTSNSIYLVVGTILILLSFGSKLALAPFHLWSPDVYEGSDFRVIYLLTIIKKVTILLVLITLFKDQVRSENFIYLVLFISILSTIWGNLSLYTQSSLKRFIAYSSVAQFGFIFSALLIPKYEYSYFSLTLYFMAYMISLLMVIAPLSYFIYQQKSDDLLTLHDFTKKWPLYGVTFILGLLSLAGVPPLPGFFAKIYLFGNLISFGYPLLSLILLLCSFLGIYAYFKVAGIASFWKEFKR